MIQARRNVFIANLRPLFFDRRFKSETATENVQKDIEIKSEVDVELAAKEVEIEKRRNKSRLRPAHFNIVHNRKPHDVPRLWTHQTVGYQRRMWGTYGEASGLDAGKYLWPTKQEREIAKEYESMAHPFTIQQMLADATEKREEQISEMYKEDKKIAAKVAKIEEWKANLREKMNKRLNVAKEAKEKKERLIEEVRRHFGFKVSPYDERFQQMIELKEKEQKKKEKEIKRAAREAQMIAKLQQKNIELLQSTESMEKNKISKKSNERSVEKDSDKSTAEGVADENAGKSS